LPTISKKEKSMYEIVISKKVEIITTLFKQNITEVVIRKSPVKLGEFDKTLKLDSVMLTLKEFGHNELLLKDIENGLKNSSVYKK